MDTEEQEFKKVIDHIFKHEYFYIDFTYSQVAHNYAISITRKTNLIFAMKLIDIFPTTVIPKRNFLAETYFDGDRYKKYMQADREVYSVTDLVKEVMTPK